jgi:hypothetical protein
LVRVVVFKNGPHSFSIVTLNGRSCLVDDTLLNQCAEKHLHIFATGVDQNRAASEKSGWGYVRNPDKTLIKFSSAEYLSSAESQMDSDLLKDPTLRELGNKFIEANKQRYHSSKSEPIAQRNK